MSKKLSRWERVKAWALNKRVIECHLCGDEFTREEGMPVIPYYTTVEPGLVLTDPVCFKDECWHEAIRREKEVGGFTGAHGTAFGQGWVQAAAGMQNASGEQRYAGFTSGSPPHPLSRLFG